MRSILTRLVGRSRPAPPAVFSEAPPEPRCPPPPPPIGSTGHVSIKGDANPYPAMVTGEPGVDGRIVALVELPAGMTTMKCTY